MPYTVELPDGKTVEFPDNVSQAQASALITKQFPEFGSKERTMGQATTDVGAGLLSGIGQLGQFPGQLYGLATGNFDKTGLYGAAQNLEQYGESLKSPGLKAREAARQKAVDEASHNGIFAEAGAAVKQTVKDPGLLLNFVAEQLPSQLPALLAGMFGPEASAEVASLRQAAKTAATAAEKKVFEDKAKEAAIKFGTKAAVGTGAVQQGADVGAQTYVDVYAELKKGGASDEQAAKGAINLARASGASGAIISLLAQNLPGAQAMERAFAGERTGLGRIGGALAGVIKEAPGEMIEEGGGKFTQNLAMREVNPNQDLTQGVGTTIGMAGLGGGVMGGVTGALAGGSDTTMTANKDLTKHEDEKIADQAIEKQTKTRNTATILQNVDEQKAAEGAPAETKKKKGAPVFTPTAPAGSLEELDQRIANAQTEVDRLQANINANKDPVDPYTFKSKRHEEQTVSKLARINAELNSFKGALAQRLANGEKRAEQPIDQSGGAGAGVPSGSSTSVPPATGTQGSTTTGVVSPRTNAPSTNVGTQQQTTTVNPTTTPPTQTSGTAPAVTPTTTPPTQTTPTTPAVSSAAQDDLDLLNSLLGSPDELPSAGSARRTPAQIATDAKVDAIAQRYGLTRNKAESSIELGQRIKNAIEFEKQRETTPVQDINNKLLAGQELKEEKGYFPSQEQRDLYEETRQEFNKGVETEDEKLPAYKELSDDERRKYFQENISQNNQIEHDKAAKVLSEYIENKRSESRAAPDYERTEAVDQIRARESYNRERGGFGSKTGLGYSFPAWNSLSDAARAAYSAINKTDTVNEQYLAFKAVKDQIQKDKLAEQTQASLEEAETQATQEMLNAAEIARKSQPAGKGAILPDHILKALLAGDIQTVLKYLSEEGKGAKSNTKLGNLFSRQIFRVLAGALSNVENLHVNVVFDENMTLNEIGKYDANTNTLYVGPNGLDEATILHELTHAATVKVIHQYFTDKTKLTARQAAAVEHLINIAAEAKRSLGSTYGNAFENVYEFIAYAMTDLDFQTALSRIQVPRLTQTTNKTEEQSREQQIERQSNFAGYDFMLDNLWNYFTGTLAYMYGVFKPYLESTRLLSPTEETGVTRKSAERIRADQERARLKGKGIKKVLKGLKPEEREKYKADLKSALEGLTEEEKKEGLIAPVKGELVIERGVTNLKRSILHEPGYRGNLLLEAANAFQNIMEAPEGGIKQLAGKEGIGSELMAAKAGAATNKADRTADQIIQEQKLPEQASVGKIKSFLTSTMGMIQLATKFQSDRFAIKFWEDALARAGKTIDVGAKLNNIYTQIALAAAKAKDLYLTHIAPSAYITQAAISEYAKAAGLKPDEALKTLNAFFTQFHEGERRAVKYMLNVPLSNNVVKNIANTGLDMTPANFREKVIDAVMTGTLSKQEVQNLRKDLNDIVKKYADPNGTSPSGSKEKDINHTNYNVIGGLTATELKNIKDKYDAEIKKYPERKAIIEKIRGGIQDLQKATTELNRQANYWSKPVQSVVDFYGWENYIPFKGKDSQIGKNDDMLNFDSQRFGRELQEAQNSFDGRETFADNSLIQTLSDATRAAMRAGRKDYTLAIKNAIDQKLLEGKKIKTISFAERNTVDLGEFKGETMFFHYNENGSVDIYAITDKAKREAIRRTYQNTNPLIDQLNNLTSAVGMFHTRYNIAFAPMNFFRDALTNAFTIAVDKGMGAAAQYIGSVAKQVVTGGLFKTFKFAKLYNEGNMKAIEAMAKSDKSGFTQDMLDYVKQGGMVSYLQGLTIKGTYKDLQADLMSNNFTKAKDATNRFFDNYMDMFELASRTAAYRISKSEYEANGANTEAAKIKATAYTKGLANFEQVGEWGRGAGAMFMFFRPAATGAVRAIETLGPMFRDTDEAIKTDLPANVQKDAKAVAAFRESHERQRKAAYAMSMALSGLGVAVYLMSLAASDDDQLGRNRAGTDDVNRWTKYARFFVPGMESPIQIPWGYGLGAFAATGAQIAAMANGQISLKEGLSNIISIGTDSFLPLPVSRINMFDNFPAWAMDTATPSIMRPFFEFQMNMDGLGREIYNNRQSRVGDAYTGGDNIPELWKDAAKTLLHVTGVDISPNTLYFFANNYADGITRIAQNGYNMGMLATGQKEFNPRSDTIFFDSFFGAKSNYDARQYSAIEAKVQDMQKMINLKDVDPQEYADYISKNPMAEFIVEDFNKGAGGTLKELRKEANDIRRTPGMSPKDRTSVLNNIIQGENIEKRIIIEGIKQYGIEP